MHSCSSQNWELYGSGTQRIEEEIQTLFPGARILRMDRDTATSRTRYEAMLKDIENYKYDILIGTQLISKGLISSESPLWESLMPMNCYIFQTLETTSVASMHFNNLRVDRTRWTSREISNSIKTSRSSRTRGTSKEQTIRFYQSRKCGSIKVLLSPHISVYDF